MEFSGQLVSLSRDMVTRKYNITFSVNEPEVVSQVDAIKDTKLTIRAGKWRAKRSLDANAYLWVILSKMADKLKTTNEELYLLMLERYGVFTHIVVKECAVEKIKQEWRTVKVLGDITVGNQSGIQLQCYFGSSTYNTKEMSVLIDGVVSEAKEIGVETLPPEELERMKAAWGIK